MTTDARPCTCPHALTGHILWDGCADPDCDCGYRYRPTSTPTARQAAKEAVAEAIRESKVRGGRA